VTSLKVMATLGSHASVAVAVPKLGVAGQSIGRMNGGQVTIGGVMSRIATVRLQEVVFPQSSVAVQVRVTLTVPGQLPGVVTSLKVTTTLASQASLAVTIPKVGVAGQSMGEVTEGHVIVGGTTSLTAMVLVQVAVLPQSSVAVQVRVTL
jgi:hypothetical protein